MTDSSDEYSQISSQIRLISILSFSLNISLLAQYVCHTQLVQLPCPLCLCFVELLYYFWAEKRKLEFCITLCTSEHSVTLRTPIS